MRGSSPRMTMNWLIPDAFDERVRRRLKESRVAPSADERIQSRNDLAWAISVGGIGTVAFAALLVATWYFASTLFLIFAGVLLGVALYAMSNLLGRVTNFRIRYGLPPSVWCCWRCCPA